MGAYDHAITKFDHPTGARRTIYIGQVGEWHFVALVPHQAPENKKKKDARIKRVRIHTGKRDEALENKKKKDARMHHMNYELQQENQLKKIAYK